MGSISKLLIIGAVLFGTYGVFQSLPDGVGVFGDVHSVPENSITLYEDVTYVNENGIRFSEQEIFDEVFSMINRAQHYILIDMFLFNDFLGTATSSYRALSSELTDILIKKKNSNENMDIVFITDPINSVYGGYESSQLKSLEDAGIILVITDLTKLRDSNPIVSGFWRAYFSWFGNSTKEGYLTNPFDDRLPKLGFRSYASLMNFKANHRKVIVADGWTSTGLKLSTLITSANPHDGSSAHTNTAIKVDDHLWKDVVASEVAVALFSGVDIPEPNRELFNDLSGNVEVQLLTEEAIRTRVLETLGALRNGDSLDMAMFYLSDRKVIQAMKQAADRGVLMRILLDPNKDAFGRKKNGIPNRSVAYELIEHSGNIGIRWCDTHGEQCHTKMLIVESKDSYKLILGSANLTRRNIGGYNLETNVIISNDTEFKAMTDAKRYFEKVWNNEGGKIYSTQYSTYKDDSYEKTILYRLMEDLGTSSF